MSTADIKPLREKLILVRDAAQAFNRGEAVPDWFNPVGGICSAVTNLTFPYDESAIRVMQIFWKDWHRVAKKYEAFPVPSWNDDYSPTGAYCSTEGKDNMWNPNHPFGAARLELLDFLIEELK